MADFGGPPHGAFDQLRKLGFGGFVTVSDLRINRRVLPKAPGVYAVVRSSITQPTFLSVGSSGPYRNRNWNVEPEVLRNRWLPGEQVVYFGKAGGSGTAATLAARIGAYISFGNGGKAGHAGGRYIWQLADAADLVFCWKATPGEEPAEVESALIAAFKTRTGAWPFANCKD